MMPVTSSDFHFEYEWQTRQTSVSHHYITTFHTEINEKKNNQLAVIVNLITY